MPGPPPTQPTPRRTGRRLLAAAAGIVLALVVAEVVLRSTHWGVFAPRFDQYHFRIRAGQSCWTFDPADPPFHVWDGDPWGRLPPGARMTYPINSTGLRGHEPELARPSILFLGDSFTFGEGVREEDTFVARVERLIAARDPSAPQTLNGGVPGYGTPEEAARLPELLLRFRPRAVVLVFVPNDPIPLDEEIGRDDLLLGGPDEPPLALLRLVRNVARRGALERETLAWYHSYYFGERRARWDAARAAIAGMRAQSESAGARFGVVLFPLIHRLSERPLGRIHDAVAACCRELAVPFLDLTPVLAVEPDHALWVHPTDHHPDARANELAAPAIADFVAGLLRR